VSDTRRPDPEFEPFPAARVRLRDFDPQDHQRLVVNPFLAVLGLLAWARILFWILESPSLSVATLLMIPALWLLLHLVQYHCLDCGRTGRYTRRDRHFCPAVNHRRNEGRSSRFPSSRGQLILWCWLLGSIAVLILVRWQ
jgi:hypothetical protein